MLREMEIARGGGGGGCCCAARAFPQSDSFGPPTEVQRIMLRFRPIAPRPAPPLPPGSTASTNSQEERVGGPRSEKSGKKRSRTADEKGESCHTRPTRTRRGPKPKQKAQVRTSEDAVAASSTVTTSATSTSEEEVGFVGPVIGGSVVALPLVPDAAATRELPPQFPTTELLKVTAGLWDRPQVAPAAAGTAGHVIAPTPTRPVCSVVTVVSTASEWEIAVDGEQQGSAGWLAGLEEDDAKRQLETDPRPAVVSDPSGKVTWTNAAYRRMVGALEDDDEKPTAPAAAHDDSIGAVNGREVRMMLVAPVAVFEKDLAAFSCRVKVRWCGAGRSGRPEKGSVTAPCDVWRLAGGCLAWRIDVEAALSLGPIGRMTNN